MWYNVAMKRKFVETDMFRRQWKNCGLTDDDLKLLQERLLHKPDMGISLGYGLYKLRVASGSHGRRGGSRVIYFEWTEIETIYFLLCYPKNKQDNFSDKQLKILHELIDNIKGGR